MPRRGLLARSRNATIILGRFALLAVAVALLQRLQREGSPWEWRLLLIVVLLALLATFAKRLSDMKVWVVYVGGLMAFLYLRTLADETGMPHFVSYPLTLDRYMFLGEVPTAWLQKHLYEPGNVRLYEVLLGTTYLSYFFVPHVVAITTWRLRPALFPRVPLAMIATFQIGLVLYFLVPTVPPWLAPELGHGPEMTRVMLTLTSQVDANGYESASRVAGVNDVGAMPSLHMALTVMVALVLAEFGRGWKYVGATYAFLMGLALVYLGEHYVTDELVGALLAVGVWKVSASRIRLPAFARNRERIAARDSAFAPGVALAANAEPPEQAA